MENAKHIGGLSALAVAVGIGMAVANTPAVASAAPADSGKGSTSSESSSSSSSPDSGSSATNGPASRPPRPLKPRGAVNKTGDPDTSTNLTSSTSASSAEAATKPAPQDGRTLARRNDRVTSRPALGNTSVSTRPKPIAVEAPTVDATEGLTGLDATANTSSAAATPADPLSHLVSTVSNAVLSPFANSAPTAPVQSPAAWTLLAFARREFDQALRPSTAVNPPAGQTTNGLVTDTIDGTSAVASQAADPGFISSTHGFFGLFSITSAADPDDNHFVAFVFESPIFTFVLTSGADPEDNLGFGAASTGVAGHTVGTFISPFLNFSVAIPIEDPFAELFTELVRLGF